MPAHTTPNQQQPREQGLFSAILPAGFEIVPPAQYLFQDANPAASSEAFISFAGRALGGRDSLGPICANYETKCAQGDWCCNTGGTCSFDTTNGAFLCCGASAGASGCARVCASGTFQCSSVCCTYGQTCYGGDTVSGYCISQGNNAYTTSTVDQNSRQTTTAYRGDYQSSSASPYGYGDNNDSTRTTSTHHTSATSTQDASRSSSTNSREQSSSSEHEGGGMSLGVQVAIGVAVPLIVILIAVGLWFCVFRRRAAKKAEAHQIYVEKNAAFAPTSDSPSPIVRDFPSLPRDAMIVATPVESYKFGRTRTRTSLPPPQTAETYDSSDSHDPGQQPPGERDPHY
ncbi:hypothetical protein B0H67DRAFT_325657 [Lasiosphaeris hirsuta]|uniref:Uncharacterized protein n=1 Tax=Lasiosphaeris hirsuta TaxID=260670 RepID=A0AA40DLE4_9PEZI|nr:hypothetical protein B0H67DRAFT_325657 [Lasiosphaeris hirsuta]